MFFKSYINKEERQEADKSLGRLMFEGLLLGGTGLGVLALIFEIAADAFSVAAYQTLLAIHGAEGHHEIAMMAFVALSVMLFLGIVPAYKAGAYLKPNAGGSGPLVEAIGPEKLRWLSWIGTSLFFLDAVLTIIISSISAADVMMLIYPEFAAYRIILAELFAFFIMVVLVALGPKRAVPLFLLGGGAFTLFTIAALSIVSLTAAGNPHWAFLAEGIVSRLEMTGVVPHVTRAAQDLSALTPAVFFHLFLRSMSSAMLGFSGYEVIPASGKHAARPKWKVINTALTLAAVFLIGTGVMQLYAASQWKIPATDGYSTLLIEYEIVAAQTFGTGVREEDIVITPNDRRAAQQFYNNLPAARAEELMHGRALIMGDNATLTEEQFVEILAYDIAFERVRQAATGQIGVNFLLIAGVLLAIILLLAQGGGYVGGAAVAANAARLGRLPHFFEDDRIGIGVIWGVSAILIPMIREVVIVESYYAFGFVSAFVITSTTVFFVREDVLIERGIDPKSDEAKSLRFAGLRGMIASYAMLAILVTQKTNALGVIVIAGTAITLVQLYMMNGGFRVPKRTKVTIQPTYGKRQSFDDGLSRAHDEARQRGIADAIHDMFEDGAFVKFNVDPDRIVTLVSYLHSVDKSYFRLHYDHDHHERYEEPSVEIEATYQHAYKMRTKLFADIEHYSHYGIFTFIDKYHANWINPKTGRDAATVQQAMLHILFPMTPHEQIWDEYRNFKWGKIHEAIWQFSRERYRWAKDQWPNLSDRITTVWILQDFGLIPQEVDIEMIISVSADNKMRRVGIHTHGPSAEVDEQELEHKYKLIEDEDIEARAAAKAKELADAEAANLPEDEPDKPEDEEK